MVSHSVKHCEELLEGWVHRELQESGKLLDGYPSSFARAGHGGEALQLLPHVVPLQTVGSWEHVSMVASRSGDASGVPELRALT